MYSSISVEITYGCNISPTTMSFPLWHDIYMYILVYDYIFFHYRCCDYLCVLMPSFCHFVNILVFQGVAVGLLAGSALGLLLNDPSAMIQFVAPPTSSCSNRLPVGVRYYYGGVLCIDCSFCFFRTIFGNFALVRPSHLRMLHPVAHSSLQAVCPDRFVDHFYVSVHVDMSYFSSYV